MGIKLNCSGCGKPLPVSDRHAGKKVRCPACSAIVRVPTAAQSQPATSQQRQWYLQPVQGAQQGPFSKAQVDQAVRSGKIDASCQIWCEGWPQWKWASEVFPGLASPLNTAPLAAAVNPLGIPPGASPLGLSVSPLLSPSVSTVPRGAGRNRTTRSRATNSQWESLAVWQKGLLAGGAVYLFLMLVVFILPALAWPIVFLLMFACFGVGVLGGLWGIVVPFQEGVAEGLMCLFVPFYGLYYLITRWSEMWKPFVTQLCALAALILVFPLILVAGMGQVLLYGG